MMGIYIFQHIFQWIYLLYNLDTKIINLQNEIFLRNKLVDERSPEELILWQMLWWNPKRTLFIHARWNLTDDLA